MELSKDLHLVHALDWNLLTAYLLLDRNSIGLVFKEVTDSTYTLAHASIEKSIDLFGIYL
jgi:hypothetical protein